MQLYVISGSDDAAVKSRALTVITEWLGPEFDSSADLEIIRGDDETIAPEDSLNEFLASALTPPFFGDGKTVWLRHWSGFKTMSDTRSTKAGEALMNRFAEEVVKPAPIDGIRLLVDGSGLDGRKSLAKLLKNSENVEFELLNLPDQKAKDFVRHQVSSISAQVKDAGYKITPDAAQELIDCFWIKLNDINKCRDVASAIGFAGYGMFQNLIVGGQDAEGRDATNILSFMCIEASIHVPLPQPSLSVRVWNGSPDAFLLKAAELTRTGIGLPAYYNDEVIIPALMSRGASLAEARGYNIIGCVEPQVPGKTDGWHDAAFFNMCRPLELVFSNGMDQGVQVGIKTGELRDFDTFDKFFDAYKRQQEYLIGLMVNADNAIDVAHAERCPLPFLSSMVEDCIGRGKSVQEGGAIYNFTGPQGFGIANIADGLYAIRRLVYEEKKLSLTDFAEALRENYGKPLPAEYVYPAVLARAEEMRRAGKQVSEREIAAWVKEGMEGTADKAKAARYQKLLDMIAELPKFGNDDDEIDPLAREAAYTYTKPLETFKNPRGGIYQAGLYPVSANVPLGGQTGATPDGRLAYTPVADGVSPGSGRDNHGPTAAANSVAKLDHTIASNGTLYNMKFHPSALAGRAGLQNFVSLIRGYFERKGMHVQFNVVSRETLLDAQKNPEKYKTLVVRVAGYSALFTTLSRSLQDDIINRTEQSGAK